MPQTPPSYLWNLQEADSVEDSIRQASSSNNHSSLGSCQIRVESNRETVTLSRQHSPLSILDKHKISTLNTERKPCLVSG